MKWFTNAKRKRRNEGAHCWNTVRGYDPNSGLVGLLYLQQLPHLSGMTPISSLSLLLIFNYYRESSTHTRTPPTSFSSSLLCCVAVRRWWEKRKPALVWMSSFSPSRNFLVLHLHCVTNGFTCLPGVSILIFQSFPHYFSTCSSPLPSWPSAGRLPRLSLVLLKVSSSGGETQTRSPLIVEVTWSVIWLREWGPHCSWPQESGHL